MARAALSLGTVGGQMLAKAGRDVLTQPAAEDALRGYAEKRGSFNYSLAKDVELLIQALRSAHEQAKAASNAKTAFLASVSHELRTPLNAIIGFAQLIASERVPATSHRGYAEDIVKGARRLLDVLSDILDMARLEGGRMQLQREAINFSDVVEEACAQLRERTHEDSAPLETTVSPDFPPVIWTDRRRMRQVLVNLLSNAMAFTSEDGKVILSADLSAGGDAQIRIVDSGCGMSPEELKRAVTRFGHAEDENSREHQGIGLGLPLAKSITELLGGRMTIESTPGKGTTVTISFSKEALREKPHQWGRPLDRTKERARLLLDDQSIEPPNKPVSGPS